MSPEVQSRAVRYVDLAGQHEPLREELLQAMGRVLDHGQFVLGPDVEEFERNFADYCGSGFAVGVNSGTDALALALRAAGIGEGDEVVTTTNTFIATVSSIVLAGATPVLVDVDDSYNMDPAGLEAVITDRTAAIIPVHLTGKPAAMDPIQSIAEKHKVMVFEDAAQSVGAVYKGKRVGGLGQAAAFSLHPLKTLNACGDGGVMTTSNSAWAESVKTMRNLGLKTRDNAVLWSGNSRLDNLQAAFLNVKLKYLDGWNERRRYNAGLYREGLAGLSSITLPVEEDYEQAAYHTFIIQAEDRDGLKAHLAEHQIETAIHYPNPVHLQDAGRSLGYGPGDFPVAEKQAMHILSLPVHQGLEDSDIETVVRSVHTFVGG